VVKKASLGTRTLRVMAAVAFAALVAPTAGAQHPGTTGSPEALLDKLTGHWMLTGTIGRKATTHDVDVDWILKREYIRLHEVSREKDAAGGPEYEAWIYIVWDAKNTEYAVLWLDNTAPFTFGADGIGHAKPDGDRIPMLFKDPDGGGIRTTFSYDHANDTWSWTIDNADKTGKLSSFANVTLTRKQ
jgi:hypothetical protein